MDNEKKKASESASKLPENYQRPFFRLFGNMDENGVLTVEHPATDGDHKNVVELFNSLGIKFDFSTTCFTVNGKVCGTSQWRHNNRIDGAIDPETWSIDDRKDENVNTRRTQFNNGEIPCKFPVVWKPRDTQADDHSKDIPVTVCLKEILIGYSSEMGKKIIWVALEPDLKVHPEYAEIREKRRSSARENARRRTQDDLGDTAQDL